MPAPPVIAGPHPATAGQRAAWLEQQLHPHDPVASRPVAWSLEGAIDAGAVSDAVRRLFELHPGLRTTLELRDDALVQSLRDVPSVRLEAVDVAPTEVDDVVRRHVDRVLDHGTELPFDPLLLRVAPDRHLLIVNASHAAVDGWSSSLLTDDLRQALSRVDSSVQPVVGTSPLFVVADEDAAAFDEATVDDAIDGLLPLPGAVGPVPSRVGRGLDVAEVVATLPPAVIVGIKAAARRLRCSVFTVVLAAAQVVLAQHAGEPVAVTGVLVARRGSVARERLVTNTVDRVLVRTSTRDRPFAEIVADVRTAMRPVAAGAFAPYEQLVGGLRRRGVDPSSFGVTIQLRNYPRPAAVAAGPVLVEPFCIRPSVSADDLSIEIDPVDDAWVIRAVHRTAVHDAATIERLVGHLVAALCGVTDPAVLADDLVPRPAPAVPPRPVAATRLWPLVTSIATTRPQELAITGPDVSLSYDSLIEDVAARVGAMRRLGVRAGDAVVVIGRRSVEQLLASIAVIAAEGVLVPLDPDASADHRRRVHEETAAVCAVDTDAATHGSACAPVLTAAGIVGMQEPPRHPELAGGYLLPTSGTTGRPKIVRAPAASIVNLAVNGRHPELGPGVITAHCANPAFDMAIIEVWPALVAGAQLYVPATGAATDPVAMVGELSRVGVTVLNIPTALFHHIASRAPDALGFLDVLVTGGEHLDPAAARRVLRSGHAPGVLRNAYGPSEAAVIATIGDVADVAADAADADEQVARVSVGPAHPGAAIEVVDHAGRPVPVGTPGEVLIGGPGVGAGYLDGEPRGFGAHHRGPGWYATGDIGRLLADGALDLIGRRDRQLKVRGARVDPALVESALQAHPAVVRSVVGLVDRGAGDRRLAAWVTVADEVDAAELRRHCKETLPDQLVPGSITFVDAIPTTAGGKPDMQRLAATPDRAPATPAVATAEEPPAGGHLKLAGSIIGRILGLDVVPDDVELADLGADSLTRIRILSRLEQRTGQQLDTDLLGSTTTVATLAAALTAGSERHRVGAAQLIVDRPVGVPVVLLHGVRGVFGWPHRNLAHKLGMMRPVMYVGPSWEVVDRPATKLTSAMASYVQDLTTLLAARPCHLVGFSSAGVCAFELGRLLGEVGVETSLTLIDSPTPWCEAIPEPEQPTEDVQRPFLQAIESYRPTRWGTDALFVGSTELVGRAERWRAVVEGELRTAMFDATHEGLMWGETGLEVARTATAWFDEVERSWQ